MGDANRPAWVFDLISSEGLSHIDPMASPRLAAMTI